VTNARFIRQMKRYTPKTGSGPSRAARARERLSRDLPLCGPMTDHDLPRSWRGGQLSPVALLLALFTLFATAASAFPVYRRALFRLVEPQREPGTRAGGSLHWGGSP